jgi:hypothetical protein
MGKKERSEVDRRSGRDRREAYDLEYFINGGSERRRFKDRRRLPEMRKGWVRVSRWHSKKVEGDA